MSETLVKQNNYFLGCRICRTLILATTSCVELNFCIPNIFDEGNRGITYSEAYETFLGVQGSEVSELPKRLWYFYSNRNINYSSFSSNLVPLLVLTVRQGWLFHSNWNWKRLNLTKSSGVTVSWKSRKMRFTSTKHSRNSTMSMKQSKKSTKLRKFRTKKTARPEVATTPMTRSLF